MKNFIFFIGVILVAVFFAFFRMNYVDEKVLSGSAYGLTIGDNKTESYKKASALPKELNIGNQLIFVEIKVDNDSSALLGTNADYTLLSQTLLHDVGFPYFNDKDEWSFYFNGTYFDSLSLKFCDDKLCEIYRHKKKFELP